MDKSLEDVPVATLRKLLIEEVKEFIICLDKSPLEDLHKMKLRLKMIFTLISEKEKTHEFPLVWGKNSTPSGKTVPQENDKTDTRSFPDFLENLISQRTSQRL
ncbi:MAG: hypothetical protein Q8927_16860 [Bacteroidota bacterium]|nr:hypothetical protein [Bacteroidota bacterium]MDP4217875.1 hypothetical protein [Bacteroidota bacterium]MDP4247561.1 hypothetical protein [Bacteroidota bacterium]MDP4254953.1 hypothetical protein [Bacteroidota bacterium]MDP4259095.1 hypothetical protein [Bacteroidota bacterium]